jgi:hypothetical protein
MTLQFSGKKERIEPHREFYGRVIDQMPLLVSGKDKEGKVVDVPRVPVSFAYVLERRMNAPEDVRETWQDNNIFTGDGVARGVDGDVVCTWDNPLLRTLTPESTLGNHSSLKLFPDQWNELRAQEGALYLSAEQVAEAQFKGYVKKGGVWQPENTIVGNVWEHLTRGRDLKSYAEMVADAKPHSGRIMTVYLDQSQLSSPNLRAWVANRVDFNSNANGNSNLSNDNGRLVGVAPEAHVALKKMLKHKFKQL